MIPTKNDLPLATRSKMVELLNQLLADGTDLYTQAKQAHWNVKGMNFIALHKLFDAGSEAVLPFLDELAERAVQLGGVAQGTVRKAAKATSLPEYPLDDADGHEHVLALRDALAHYGKELRKGIDASDKAGDMDTNDLIIGISSTVDKYLWFVEAHVQEEASGRGGPATASPPTTAPRAKK
jgi:starvation-inducible DNA-binding protein